MNYSVAVAVDETFEYLDKIHGSFVMAYPYVEPPNCNVNLIGNNLEVYFCQVEEDIASDANIVSVEEQQNEGYYLYNENEPLPKRLKLDNESDEPDESDRS